MINISSHESNSRLVMYFTVNTAFVNYLDQLTNLIESLEILIIKNKTTFEQTPPIENKFTFTLYNISV